LERRGRVLTNPPAPYRLAERRRYVSMPVVALDHIVLNVKDVERSLDFYQRCLGLAAERVEAWRSGQVRFPSVRISSSTIIDLVKVNDTSDGGTRTNLAHFCLTTDSSDLEG